MLPSWAWLAAPLAVAESLAPSERFNPHPPLTSFPLSFMCALALYEVAARFSPRVAAWHGIRPFLVLLLVCITPVTFFSGYWGAEYAQHVSGTEPALSQTHELLGRLVLLTLVPFALFAALLPGPSEKDPPRRVVKWCYGLTTFLLLGLLVLTSRAGGMLVFSHGAGVSRPAGGPSK